MKYRKPLERSSLVLDIDACKVLALAPVLPNNDSIGTLIIELGPHVYECEGLVIFAMVNRELAVRRKNGLIYFREAIGSASNVGFGDNQLEGMLFYERPVVGPYYEASAPCECAGSALFSSASKGTVEKGGKTWWVRRSCEC